ncbi:MAG: hypothetical protein JW969_02765 [Spirochaetales bacterium]|nr:hypothetical protein [Spirochaetales bacterium]
MEMETEEKAGVDAFRIRIPIGFMQEIDTGIVFGESFLWEKTACFLRSKFYFWESDWTFLSMKFFNSLLFGFDFTKALGSSLIWLETAFVLTDVLKSGYTFGNMDYIRISVGFDYNIAGALYSFIEYHFNSGGCEKAEDYDDYMTSSLYNEGSIDLLARHYLNVGFNYDISSVMSLSAGVLVNMNDFSFSVLPIFKHNIEENIYFSLGASINVGIAPVLDIYSVPPIVMNSEFGSYPSTVFCSIKFYF